jgi:hypothetical protein
MSYQYPKNIRSHSWLDIHSQGEHQRFLKEHFVLKGEEASQACVQTLNAFEQLKTGT